MFIEWVDYRRIHLEPSLIVDRSRGEKLVISMDITFPRVPCYRECQGPIDDTRYLDGYLELYLVHCMRTKAEYSESDWRMVFEMRHADTTIVLSLDVMDISGEHQSDLEHSISKTRLSKDGRPLQTTSGQLKGDVERANLNQDPSYCGSCYGASPPESG